MPEQAPLTPEQLTIAGEALYGAGWKRALASALGLRDEARLARMAAGQSPIPSGFRGEIVEIARERIRQCETLISDLSES